MYLYQTSDGCYQPASKPLKQSDPSRVNQERVVGGFRYTGLYILASASRSSSEETNETSKMPVQLRRRASLLDENCLPERTRNPIENIIIFMHRNDSVVV